MSPIFGSSKETKPGRPAKEKVAPKRANVTLAMCEGLVSFLNLAYQVSPWRDDALDELEQKALAKSLHAAAKQNIWLGNIIVKITTASAEGQLVAAVGAIVVARLAKHEKVPPMLGLGAYGVIAGIASAEEEMKEAFDGMGAGGARSSDRSDGNREDDASGNPAQSEEVRRGAPDEIGYLGLAEIQGGNFGGITGLGEERTRRRRPNHPEAESGETS